MVVILGRRSDLCARLTDERLRRQGVETVFIEEDELLRTAGFTWSLDGPWEKSYFLAGSTRIPLPAVTGILARVRDALIVPLEVVTQERQYVALELRAALVALLNCIECPVINRPSLRSFRPLSTGAEIAEALLACGFTLPRSLMTSRVERASRFYEECGGAVLAASPCGLRPWSLVQGPGGGERLAVLLAQHPVLLQELPAGQWVRVYSLGDRAWAAPVPIEPWSKSLEMGPLHRTEIPILVPEQCGRLAERLGLEFAQMELVRTGAGEICCLGVSAWPNYEACDDELRASITAGLADWLEGREKRARNDPDPGRAGRSASGLRRLAPSGQRC